MNADLKDAGEEIQVYLHSKFHDDNDDFYFLFLLSWIPSKIHCIVSPK